MSAGQRDARQLTICGLEYLKELHEGRDPRFTGCKPSSIIRRQASAAPGADRTANAADTSGLTDGLPKVGRGLGVFRTALPILSEPIGAAELNFRADNCGTT